MRKIFLTTTLIGLLSLLHLQGQIIPQNNDTEPTAIVTPSEDTYRQRKNDWDANLGMTGTMLTYYPQHSANAFYSIMLFNPENTSDANLKRALSSPELIKKVNFQVYCGVDETQKTYTNLHTLLLFLYDGADWTEDSSGIQIGTQVGSTYISSLETTLQENKYYELEVTQSIKDFFTNNDRKAFTLLLGENSAQKNPSNQNIYIPWHSKENESGYAPRLVFTFVDAEFLQLSEIKVGGDNLPEFNPDTYIYRVSLPYEAQSIPSVEGIISTGAEVTYTNATNPDGTEAQRTTSIRVKDTNSDDYLVYKIIFNRLPQPSESRLASIEIDGEPIELFDGAESYVFYPDQDTYTYYLPYDYDKVPEIAASPVHPNANVSVGTISKLSGVGTKSRVTITNTAPDGVSTKNYYIDFEILPKLDLFLCIGQSNMAGRGVIDSAAGDLLPVDNVYLLAAHTQMEIASNPYNKHSNIRKGISWQGMNPTYSFSQKMKEATGRPIGMIVNAKGGTSIKNWVKGQELYDASITRALAAKKWGEFKAVLWHQGETDMSASSTYPERLTSMVNSLRSDLGSEQLFFVAGQLAPWQDAGAFNTMIKTIPTFLDNAGYVSTEDMTDSSYMLKNASDPHFSRKGNIELGERYAEIVLTNVYGGSDISTVENGGNSNLRIEVEGLQLHLSSEEPMGYTIVDMTGRVVAQKQEQTSASFVLEKGVYLVSAVNEMVRETRKVAVR